jgi:hypothetical protein
VRSTRGQGSPEFFCFNIGGLWDDLAFSADVRNLIRRSDAAAPLFLQQRDARKPSVIQPSSAEAGQ